MKKYFMLFIFSNILLFSQNPPFNGNGDGSIGNPYQLWTIGHLIELNDSTYNDYWYNAPLCFHCGKYFKLMENIDGVTTQIVGWYFSGHFNGNGKKITANMNYPLFGALQNGGTIDNLILDGYIYSDDISIAGILGSIYTGGVISNCINNATIICTDDGSKYGHYGKGAIVAIILSSTVSVINCINNGDITGVDRIGGIAGENDGTIINCINTGNITATASGDNSIFSGVGGIVGTVANYCQSISNCVNLGSVVGQGFVGGIVGLARGMGGPAPPTPITNCINYGYVRGINGVGGILGYMFNQYVNVSNCVNVGVVEGEEDIGSIVGKE